MKNKKVLDKLKAMRFKELPAVKKVLV